MTSPGKTSDRCPQGTDQSQNAGGDSPPQHPPRPTETENVPPPQQQEVEAGEGGEGGERVVIDLNVAVTETVNVPVEVPAEQGPQRKRGRVETAGASGSGEKRHKKKGELVEIPSKPPTCYVCQREFQSWKAVFGHMRSHKVGEERARTGAFPPPVFTPPRGSPEREQQALQEQLVPTLLNIAQEVLNRTEEAAADSSSVGATVQQQIGSSSSRTEIDLNLPQEPSPAASPPTSPTKDGKDIDLNIPPPDNAGDDDDNAGVGTA